MNTPNEEHKPTEDTSTKDAAVAPAVSQQGDVDAMFDLGVMYEHGQGVEQSYERAVEYYAQAAHLGFAGAQKSLGALYGNGQGVQRDLKKAREWWTKAAAQGNEDAIKFLKTLDKEEG